MPPEKIENLAIGNLVGAIGDDRGLDMFGSTAADLLIGRVFELAAGDFPESVDTEAVQAYVDPADTGISQVRSMPGEPGCVGAEGEILDTR